MKWGLQRLMLVFVSLALVLVSGVLIVTSVNSTAPAFIAGLVGAVVGAGGSVAAQIVSARLTDRRTLVEWQNRSQADAAAAARAVEQAARANAFESTSRLLDLFTRVHRELQDQKPSLSEVMTEGKWEADHWGIIWTPKRSLTMDKYGILVVDPAARKTLRQIVRLLDALDNVTSPWFPGRLEGDLRTLALGVTSIGVEIVATYLRSEPYSTEWDERLEQLQRASDNYDAFEADAVERSIEAAEEEEAAAVAALEEEAGATE